MIKPDPTMSRINSLFADTLLSAKKVDELEDLKRQGNLLFTPEEINETSSMLDRALRKFCVDNHITDVYFAEKYKLYALRELNMHPTQASNNRSNLTKALKLGNITFKRFLEVMCHVLGYTVNNLRLELSDSDGQVQTLNFGSTKDWQ